MSSTLSSSLEPELTTVAGQADKSSSEPRKAIFAISLGNGLEMYDFTVYSFLPSLLASYF